MFSFHNQTIRQIIFVCLVKSKKLSFSKLDDRDIEQTEIVNSPPSYLNCFLILIISYVGVMAVPNINNAALYYRLKTFTSNY